MSDSPANQSAARSRDRSSRKERIPLGVARARLTVADKDPNYEYRWVKGSQERLAAAESGGYEFVTEAGKVGEGAKDGNTDMGARVSQVVGTNTDGSPRRDYLMRIPKDLYREDQAAKQAQVDEVDKAIKRGDAHQRGDDKRYVPKDGIKIRTAKVRVADSGSGE